MGSCLDCPPRPLADSDTSRTHKALATYHSHPPTAPLVTSHASPSNLYMDSQPNPSQISSTPTLAHAPCGLLRRTCWPSPAPDYRLFGTGHSLPMLSDRFKTIKSDFIHIPVVKYRYWIYERFNNHLWSIDTPIAAALSCFTFFSDRVNRFYY